MEHHRTDSAWLVMASVVSHQWHWLNLPWTDGVALIITIFRMSMDIRLEWRFDRFQANLLQWIIHRWENSIVERYVAGSANINGYPRRKNCYLEHRPHARSIQIVVHQNCRWTMVLDKKYARVFAPRSIMLNNEPNIHIYKIFTIIPIQDPSCVVLAMEIIV